MNRSTKLIIDDIREVLQVSSPDIPGEDNTIEKTLHDLAKVEKRHEMLLEACEVAEGFVEWCMQTANPEFTTEAWRVLAMIRSAINKAKGDDDNS